MNAEEIYRLLGVSPQVCAIGERVQDGLRERFAAVARIADNAGHIVGVAGDLVVAEGADAQTAQPLFKGFHLGGGGVLGHAHAAHIQPIS